jgi:hypothetical protein
MKCKLLFLSSIIFIIVGCSKSTNESVNKILVQNYYWANEGMEEQVYQQRLLASAVRSKYGLPVGRVLKLETKSDSLPNVIWQCEYANSAARELDLEKFQENEALATEFRKVSSKMGTLIRKFDRAIYQIAPEPEGAY